MKMSLSFFHSHPIVGFRILHFSLTLLTLLIFFVPAKAATQSEHDIRGWTPTKRLIAHDNQAKLRLKMVPCSTCRLGETMQIVVNSQQSGFLFLMDINGAGQLTRIFPNQYIQPQAFLGSETPIASDKKSEQRVGQGYIQARQTVIIPDEKYGFDFTATEPIGKGLVVALLVEEGFVHNVLLPKAFKTVEPPQAYTILQQLSKHLNTILTTDSRPVRWSITAIDYEITR